MGVSTRPNVVLIALDCVRADHLRCYGYRGTETPIVDRIAAEGAVFEQAVCQCPNTWVSFASMFTGCNPYHHGVRTRFAELSPQRPTLAEALKALGYRTAGFPGFGFLTRERHFDRGFDDYFLNEAPPPKGLEPQHGCQEPGKQLELLFEWMDRPDDRPFLAWLHYVHTHMWPQELLPLPREYRTRFSDAWQYYDGKISYADDSFIRPIWEGLAQRGLLDRTILVVTSDHGEVLYRALPPIDCTGHGNIPVDQAIRVPLLMRAPSLVPAGRRVPDQVRTIDLMPTLLELCGGAPIEDVDGASLVCLLAGRPDPAHPRDAYIENLHRGEERAYIGIRTERWKLLLIPPPPAVSVSPKLSRSGLRKIYRRLTSARVIGEPVRRMRNAVEALIRPAYPSHEPWTTDPVGLSERILNAGHAFALYDLMNDPEEYHDVALDHPEVVQGLLVRLRNMVAAESVAAVREVQGADRDALEEQLRTLGYM